MKQILGSVRDAGRVVKWLGVWLKNLILLMVYAGSFGGLKLAATGMLYIPALFTKRGRRFAEQMDGRIKNLLNLVKLSETLSKGGRKSYV